MTLDRLYDRRVFVAERDGDVIGFVVASPVPLREGWLIEQIMGTDLRDLERGAVFAAHVIRIASAFTQSSPVRAIIQAILKALRAEIDWFTEKLRWN